MTQNNKIIAVTGGIGSGKSTVCKIIKESGFSVISCDEIYSELLNRPDFLNTLCKEFGGVIAKNGSLDRKKLAEIAFNDEANRKKLEEITHPAIMSEVFTRAKGFSICFCEVPLLFEKGYEKLFNNVIVVLRPLEDRILSVQKRDGLSREGVILRLKNQIDYESADFAKYYVIHNGGSFGDLKAKTVEILNKITQFT